MPISLFLYLGIALIFVAILSVCVAVNGPLNNLVKDYSQRYLNQYTPHLKLLFWSIPASKILLVHLSIIVALMFIGFFLGKNLVTSIPLSIIFAFFGYLSIPLFLKIQLENRRKLFNQQLQDSLVTMANTLKATPTLIEGFRTVAENMPPPISQEFSLLIKEYHLGYNLDQSLLKMAERMKSPDLNLTITALTIGRTTGGNIPTILEEIAYTLREINRLEGLIESKTAEGKMQGWVMGLLPIGLAIALYFLDENMIKPLFTTNYGYLLLGIIVALESAGIFLIRKVSTIDI